MLSIPTPCSCYSCCWCAQHGNTRPDWLDDMILLECIMQVTALHGCFPLWMGTHLSAGRVLRATWCCQCCWSVTLAHCLRKNCPCAGQSLLLIACAKTAIVLGKTKSTPSGIMKGAFAPRSSRGVIVLPLTAASQEKSVLLAEFASTHCPSGRHGNRSGLV